MKQRGKLPRLILIGGLVFSLILMLALFLTIRERFQTHSVRLDRTDETLTGISDFWPTLATYDFENAKIPPELEKLIGQRVVIRGYVLPIKAKKEISDEVLIVPTRSSGIHEPPPPPNQMLMVELKSPIRISEYLQKVEVDGYLAERSHRTSFGDVHFSVLSAVILKTQ